MSRTKLYQKIKNNYGAINRRIGENYPVEKVAELITPGYFPYLM